MADIQEKNPSVELDTDGVNDQTIEVETPTESTTEFEKKEDVDLGYTDVSGGKTAKELLQEAKQTEAEEPKAEPMKTLSGGPSLIFSMAQRMLIWDDELYNDASSPNNNNNNQKSRTKTMKE